MKNSLMQAAAAAIIATTAATAWADDVEGKIEGLDTEARSLTIQGITFFTTPTTDYEDGLKSFDDLRVGQRVEVDYTYHDGRHVATEIELDD
ncbi:MAG: DUF5666 domain-containing protein [Zoogloeaceae bacterium]|nr:DUF5666 domain-containing protein [Zoogloeaceae bacterium]